MPFFNRVLFKKQGFNPDAPTVSIGASTPSSPDPLEDASNSWPITYSGTVTAYNLISSEVSVEYGTCFLSSSLSGTISVEDGTTATPTVRFTHVSGQGTVRIRIEPGACQNGGVNNLQSDWSTPVCWDEGK